MQQYLTTEQLDGPKESKDLSPLEDPEQQSNYVREDILAFRTTTTLLAQIPRQKPLDHPIDWAKQLDSDGNLELKIYDAFAKVVIGQQNVAVTSCRTPHERGVLLNVLVCTDEAVIDGNFGRGDPEQHLSITHPEPPADLGNLNALEYVMNLVGSWKGLSLANHLWILSNILVPQNIASPAYGKGRLSQYLTQYIIGTCKEKMSRRFNDTRSMDFFDSLKKVEPQDMPTISEPGPSKVNPTNQHNDLCILKHILNYYTKTDKTLEARIPNLMKMSKNLPSDRKSFLLYTNETSQEFHLLLLYLLRSFQEGLTCLMISQEKKTGSTDEEKPIHERPNEGTSKDAEKLFQESLHAVSNAGMALSTISGGHAIQMHLRNISHMLHVRKDQQDDCKHDAVNCEEDDDELHEIWTTIDFTRNRRDVHPYLAWLRLVVSHFDAVEVLLKYFAKATFQYSSVCIDIMVAPRTDQQMLPWRQLFQNDTYIPERYIYEPSDPHMLGVLQTRSDQLAFLKSVHELNAKWQSDTINDLEFADFDQHLTNLIASENVELSQLATHIQDSIKEFLSLPATEQRTLNKSETTDKIEQLFALLGGPMQLADDFIRSLDDENGFRATLHCETFLAAILQVLLNQPGQPLVPIDVQYQLPNQLVAVYKDLNKYSGSRIIGLSKRCCPICNTFLQNMDAILYVRGANTTISPCTLPLWTPPSVVKTMNATYGKILKEDIDSLLRKSDEDRRKHFNSTGLESPSLDSDSDDDWW